jgi:hypothetical protein
LNPAEYARLGRPRKTSPKLDRIIVKRARALKPYFSARQISAYVERVHDVRVSPLTVWRRLHAVDFHRRMPTHVRPLTLLHKKKRLALARRYLHFDFRRMLSSDESYYQLGTDVHEGGWVEGHEKIVRERYEHGPIVGMWGVISSFGTSKLKLFSGSLHATEYTTLLRTSLQPMLIQHAHHHPVFQQDNSRVHTSKIVTHFISDNNIATMQWPPNSPDLSPIENVWRRIKSAVHRHDPHTVEEAQRLLRREWGALPLDYLQRLFRGMGQRMRKVVKNKGGRI